MERCYIEVVGNFRCTFGTVFFGSFYTEIILQEISFIDN